MNLKDRNEAIKKLFEECGIILGLKGADYSGKEDAYMQFKLIGELLDIPPRKVLLVFYLKHVLAITNAVKRNPENPERLAESLRESIKDAINYPAILAAWPREEVEAAPVEGSRFRCPRCGNETVFWVTHTLSKLDCGIHREGAKLFCKCQTPYVEMEPIK